MIIDETIHLLEDKYGSFQNIFLRKVIFGLHITAVELSEGQVGFSSTVPPADSEVHCRKDKRHFGPFTPTQFTGQSVKDLFALPYERNLILSLKAAVINALSFPFLGNNRGRLLAGADPVDLINREWLSGKKVSLVGAFHSYIEKFAALDCQLKVLELNENALQDNEKQYFAPAPAFPYLLPESDLVVITGLTLVNQTFADLANVLSPNSLNIVTGPTSSFLPNALFNQKIHLVGGTRITQPDLLFQLAAEGGAGYHLFRYCAEKFALVENINDPRLKIS